VRQAQRLIILILIAGLAACQGNTVLEDRFAADPSLSASPNQPLPTENPESAIPSIIPRYPQAQLVPEQSQASPDRGSLRWTSSDPANLIEEYYQNQLMGQGWQILQEFAQDGSNKPLIAQKDDFAIKVEIVAREGNTEFTTDYKRQDTNVTTTPSPQPSPTAIAPNNSIPSDLSAVPEPLRASVQDVSALGIIPSNIDFKSPITRQEFAKWLVTANNQFFVNNSGKQIRLGTPNSQPIFNDVLPSNPAFAEIQGLAEAGLIPSPLTGDNSATLFRPTAMLNRETLIDWKTRLDLRKLPPTATIENIKETWGFQDAAKINPKVLRSLYADYQNSDQANIRRVFGFTTLLQPQKPVTYAEAAAAIAYFGYQGDGLSAADARQLQSQPEPSVDPNVTPSPSP
jgi:hypothetical protein